MLKITRNRLPLITREREGESMGRQAAFWHWVISKSNLKKWKYRACSHFGICRACIFTPTPVNPRELKNSQNSIETPLKISREFHEALHFSFCSIPYNFCHILSAFNASSDLFWFFPNIRGFPSENIIQQKEARAALACQAFPRACTCGFCSQKPPLKKRMKGNCLNAIISFFPFYIWSLNKLFYSSS